MVLNRWVPLSSCGNNNQVFVDSFNFVISVLRLNPRDTHGIEDISSYENAVEITDKKDDTFKVSNPDEALEENYILNLDGTNYAKIQYSETIDLTGDITVSMWIYSDKWCSNPGYHLLDNGFRGGWSTAIFNGFYNPTIAVGEATYGHVLSFSDNLIPYTDNILVSSSEPSINPDNVVVTDELYVYVFDKINKTLGKFEYTGDLIDLIDFSAHVDIVTNSKSLVVVITFFILIIHNKNRS